MKREAGRPLSWSHGKSEEGSNLAALTPVRKNMDQNQKRGSTERIESPGIARSKGVDRIIGLGNLCAIVKHINAVKARGMLEAETLMSRMEHANRKRLYRLKPDMGLDNVRER